MLTVVSGRILVVDDDANWAYVIKRLLTRSGNEVVGVESDTAALQAMEEEAYDIVIIDVLLPGVSGIDLIPRIRAAHPQTTIYVISGDSSSYSAARALQLGAERCIDKSIEPAALQEMVGSTLERRLLLKSLREERGRFEQLIENAPIGVFAIDLAGYAPEEVVGHVPMDFVTAEDQERLLSRLRARIEGNALPPGEKTIYRFTSKDGRTIDLQVETHIVDVGEERFIEGTARDVTAEMRFTQLREIVLDLGQSILSSHDIDHILQSVPRRDNRAQWISTCGCFPV